MRNKTAPQNFYGEKLRLQDSGGEEFEDYLMRQKDHIQIHFFEFKTIDPKDNYR